MKSKFLALAIFPALLIGIACSSNQRTANTNANTTREASYKDSLNKALEQADLKDVNVDEGQSKNTI